MWSKTFITASLLVSQVYGHAVFTPNAAAAAAITKGQVVRAPNPCDAATALASPIPADANGNFAVVAQSFDKGADGATTLKTGAVDTTAQGTTFADGAVTAVTDGVAAPPSQPSTADLTLALPANTKCAGGADGATCLVSLTTGGGFQNCLAVTQSGGAAAAAGAANAAAATDAAAAAAATDVSAAAATDVAAAAAATSTDVAAAAAGAAGAGTAAAAAAGKGKGKGKAKGKGKGKKGAAKGKAAAVARRPMRFARNLEYFAVAK